MFSSVLEPYFSADRLQVLHQNRKKFQQNFDVAVQAYLLIVPTNEVEEISFLTTIYCQPLILHATLVPTMRTSRRLRGQPPEGRARREVGSADSREASPLGEGFARESVADNG